MAALRPNIIDIPFASEKHTKVLEYLRKRIDAARIRRDRRLESWEKSEKLFTSYVSETTADSRRRSKRDNQGLPQYVTVTIPYSYATLMTAHAYWTSVFLARDPVLQVQGISGEAQVSEQAVEALLQHYIINGNNLVPYFIWLLDQGKYGEGILGTCWDVERHYIPELREVPRSFAGITIPGTIKKEWTSREVIGYEGLKHFNVRPADFLFDPTVTLQSFQNGEFAGHDAFIPLLRLKDGASMGRYFNIDHVMGRKESSRTRRQTAVSDLPRQNNPSTGDDGDGVDFTEITIEISPRELGLAPREYLEKWSFSIANDSVIVGAQPQGWYHNRFMYDTLEHEMEGYNVSKRGMMEMLEPLNKTLDWLINSHFFNVRRTLNNEIIYDPSVLLSKDVEAPGPGKLIRFRPDAYGKDVRQAFYQFQTQDVTQGHMKDTMLIIEMMQRLTGVNDAVMGMVQSGRRSATEIRTSTSMAVNRLKTQCEYYSAMGFSPHTKRMIQTSQQMMVGREAQLYRMVGNRAATMQPYVKVGPQEIAGSYSYIPVDGTLPIDRAAQATVFTQMLSQMSGIPQVAQGYDWVRLFGYAAELSGIRSLDQFRVNVVPDATAAAQAQAGNLVPSAQAANPLDTYATGIDPEARQ